LRLDDYTDVDGVSKASVFFGNTTQEWFYMASANTHLRQINIIFSKKWLEDYLSDEESGEMLSGYVSLKTPFVIYELMDAEYKRLMNEAIQSHNDKQFEPMVLQNRVALILERFFCRIYKGIENENNTLKISSRELRSIKQVEVFGLPVNQYYQRHRMNKAKAMLLSKKYSVREAATELGFSSVSSFNKAFYKIFDELPVEIAVSLK
jgi:AraC-like DNA-binding protein